MVVAADAGGAAPIRVYVHLGYGAAADGYAERFEQGLTPDRSLYGFHEAARFGCVVTFASDRLSGWQRWLSGHFQRRFDLDPIHGWTNRRAMAQADVIWTMSEFDAMSVRALMRLGLVPRRPVVGTMIWMAQWWTRLSRVRRAVCGPLLEGVDHMAVHTRPCLALARERLPRVRSALMHFGIAAGTYTPMPAAAPTDRIRIVAAGNDHTRDWDVVLRAFGNVPGVDLVIINRDLPDDLLRTYANLTIPRQPSMAQMRSYYAGATYIAVPMHENVYSGITVALEAMAMGVPLVSTRTGGVPTYCGEDEALFVPVGDADAWRAAVASQTPAERTAMAARARARFLREDYSTVGLMRQFVAATHAVMDGRTR